MTGTRFWRDASQRLCFDLSHISDADYPAVCKDVVSEFALAQESELVVGPDQMFWEYRRGEQVISLDWDIWMRFMVAAKTSAAETLVQDISAWLQGSRWGK